MGVSAVILTKNEEKFIEGCLENISPVVDEIIIVDGYSTDRTLEIARRYTNKIYTVQYKNFNDLRMFGTKKSKNTWVLHIDADERLSPDLKEFLESKRYEIKDDIVAYAFPRRNYYDINRKKWTKHVFYPDYQIRLFNKNNITYSRIVHERPIVYGGTLKYMPDNYYIIHVVPRHFEYSTFREHHFRYTKLEAKQRKRLKRNYYYLIHGTWEAIFTFGVNFIYKRGFLDGIIGLKASLMLALYKFMVNWNILTYEG